MATVVSPGCPAGGLMRSGGAETRLGTCYRAHGRALREQRPSLLQSISFPAAAGRRCLDQLGDDVRTRSAISGAGKGARRARTHACSMGGSLSDIGSAAPGAQVPPAVFR
ncbi:hypothetical protein PsYK624_165030 [Phanerochaete sordida]|uniref:Uncharacterized protein n=1 Tax=Phanerochaete sordida TaxID=48140 RepID=A0A9P3GRL1_9APHY|nr:hypothetical protein PsYK624_165030 [Phanerochaete sordida]